MRRREFLALFGGAAACVWSQGMGAQPRLPTIGFLRSTPSAPFAHLVSAFRQGLSETGFVESENVAIEYRWADNDPDKLPALAADLVRRQVAVIVGNIAAVEAVRAATGSIPIVFVVGDDPVKTGLVDNLSRPFFGGGHLNVKRLELLNELAPAAGLVAVLVDPSYRVFETELPDLTAAARSLGRRIVVVKCRWAMAGFTS